MQLTCDLFAIAKFLFYTILTWLTTTSCLSCPPMCS